jgi:hypothetical protein
MLAGSGKASAPTRSNSGRPATASSSAVAVASMAGIIVVTRFTLNARAAGLRSRACAGSSRLTIDGCGLCPPASMICCASGTSGTSGAWATAAE